MIYLLSHQYVTVSWSLSFEWVILDYDFLSVQCWPLWIKLPFPKSKLMILPEYATQNIILWCSKIQNVGDMKLRIYLPSFSDFFFFNPTDQNHLIRHPINLVTSIPSCPLLQGTGDPPWWDVELHSPYYLLSWWRFDSMREGSIMQSMVFMTGSWYRPW